MKDIRRALICAAAGIAVSMIVTPAQASDYPDRPITMLVPFPAGGAVDIVARLVADKMATELKTAIVVENRPGAGGTVGSSRVARAKPDGYTLLLGTNATHVLAPLIYSKLAYNATRDFVPIGQLTTSPLVIVSGAKSQASDLRSLLAELKAAGPSASYGSNGAGTLTHLAGELLKHAQGLELLHVPYKGGPAVAVALIGGDVWLSINVIPVVQGLIESGRLKAIATTGQQRTPALPEVPTVGELGHKALESSVWYGMWAPAETPSAIVDTLSATLKKVLDMPETRAELEARGDVVNYRSSEELRAFIRTEGERWGQIVKAANISLD